MPFCLHGMMLEPDPGALDERPEIGRKSSLFGHHFVIHFSSFSFKKS